MTMCIDQLNYKKAISILAAIVGIEDIENEECDDYFVAELSDLVDDLDIDLDDDRIIQVVNEYDNELEEAEAKAERGEISRVYQHESLLIFKPVIDQLREKYQDFIETQHC